MKVLERLSLGVGDRFGHQAEAQLRAFEQLAADGCLVTPVWNKSNREHGFVGSQPSSVLDAAQRAVTVRRWNGGWHVDADHIRLDTVDPYLDCSDFFTLDVADFIGRPAAAEVQAAFVQRHPELIGTLEMAGLSAPLDITTSDVTRVAAHYLLAVEEAGKIYRHIAAQKGSESFIAEVSMDETDAPQTPLDLLVILAALADAGVPLQTIAPKFTGRFNKGVDYVGDLAQFEREFNDDLAVIAQAIASYGLPANLKLSVHSGSDKFRLYPIIGRAIRRTGAGIHVKTAGTTWLEELIGLAEAGGDGLSFATQIYAAAREHVDELCAPYASVIDIDRDQLPPSSVVDGWSGQRFASSLRHVPGHPEFNPHMRQLLHVSFKVAAKEGSRYTDLLAAHADVVGRHVTENLYARHMKPLFLP